MKGEPPTFMGNSLVFIIDYDPQMVYRIKLKVSFPSKMKMHRNSIKEKFKLIVIVHRSDKF